MGERTHVQKFQGRARREEEEEEEEGSDGRVAAHTGRITKCSRADFSQAHTGMRIHVPVPPRGSTSVQCSLCLTFRKRAGMQS